MNLILASNSPRRKEILKNEGYDFKIIPSAYDEKISNLKYSDFLIENCAYNKALDVFNKIEDKNSIIISADTVVVLNDKILGKPKDEEDALKTLQMLSNKTHFVATAICLIKNDKVLKSNEKTFVTFRELSSAEILKYIKDKKPLDKAGSYGIQDEGFDFSIKTVGELDNVIGFPMKLFKKLMSEI